MREFLEARKSELVRRDLIVADLCYEFSRGVEDWRTTLGEQGEQRGLPQCNRTYIVDCPKMHGVAASVLGPLFGESLGRHLVQEAETIDLGKLDVRCPHQDHNRQGEDSADWRVTRAVLIQPLTHIQTKLSSWREEVQSHIDRGTPHPLIEELRAVPLMNPVTTSRASKTDHQTPSGANSPNQRILHSPKKFDEHTFKIWNRRRQTSPSEVPSTHYLQHHSKQPSIYRFDSSGHHLLLWTAAASEFYRTSILAFSNNDSELPCTRVPAKCVKDVAGGDNVCAALCHEGGDLFKAR